MMKIVFYALFIIFYYNIVNASNTIERRQKRTLKPRNGHLSGRGIPGDPVNKHPHEGQRTLAAKNKVSQHKSDYKFLYDEHEETKKMAMLNDVNNNLDAKTLRKMKLDNQNYNLEEPSGFKMAKRQLSMDKDGFKNYLKYLENKNGKSSSLRGLSTSSSYNSDKTAINERKTYDMNTNLENSYNHRALTFHDVEYCWAQPDKASCDALGDKCKSIVQDDWFSCQENPCHVDNFRSETCSMNMHCFDNPDDEYCQGNFPCVDCPQCASVPMCSDMLLQCDSKMSDTTWLQTNVPNTLHPCNNEACAKDKESSKCEKNVYDYCCDEDLAEDCNPSDAMKALRATTPCSPQGCSNFKSANYFDFSTFDWNSLECPFDDDSICEGECVNYQANIFLELEFNVLMFGSSLMTEAIDVDSASSSRKLLDDLKKTVKKPSSFEQKLQNFVKNNNNKHQHVDKIIKTKGGWPTDSLVFDGVVTDAYTYDCTDDELKASLEFLATLDFGNKVIDGGGMDGLNDINCVSVNNDVNPYEDAWSIIGCALTAPESDKCPAESFSDVTYDIANRNLVCILDAFNGQRSNPGGMSAEDYELLVALGDKLVFDCYGLPRAATGGGGSSGDNDNGYEWDYDGVCTQSNAQCGPECCTVLDSIADGTYTSKSQPFGTPYGDPYACGQLVDPDTQDLKNCLGIRCKSCYAEYSGPLGDWGVSNYDYEVINTKKAREPCAKQINTYCSTSAGSSDTSCQSTCDFDCDDTKASCPCNSGNTCKAYFESSFAVQSACADYKAALTKAYIEQGFLRPSGWHEEWLLEQGSLPYPKAGVNAVFDDTAIQSLEASCPQASNLKSCMPTLLDHCNSDHAWHSDTCRSLSICGDGMITWGESCDDGGYNAGSSGCDSCQYISDFEQRVCKPGQVCELCITASGNSTCPFCLNQKARDLESPCFSTVCANVQSYEDAKACDAIETNYCNAIAAKGMIDKGCQNREDKAPFYVVPATEGGNCTYDIRTLEVGTDRLAALKFAIIECKLVSAGDIIKDTTPYVPYTSLKHYLKSSTFDTSSIINAGNKTKLNALSRFPKNELVSMELLTDFELIPEIDTTLINAADGQSLYDHQDLYQRHNRFYQSAIGIGLKSNNYWWHDTDPSTCEARNDLHGEVYRLPPCDDPIMTLTSALLKRANYYAVRKNWWEFEDFRNITNVDESLDLKCNPKKGVIQVAVLLSETRYEYRDGVESLFEFKKGYGDNGDCWSNPTTCSNLEDAVKNGDMFVSIGSSLYQKGCTSRDCKFRVDPCAQLGLRPADPEVNIPLLKQQISSLINDTNLLKTAKNWNDIFLAEIQISARAVSEPLHRMKALYNSLSFTGQKTRFLKDVEDYCPHEWHIYNESTGTWDQNREWVEDPCCNWDLRQYQCCAPKDVANGKVTIVTGFDDAKLQSVCQNPNRAKNTMKDLQKQQLRAASAAAELAELTDKSAYDEFWEMEYTCRSKIENWDKDWDEDHCNSDSDCYCSYATCNTNLYKNRCEVPADSEYLCFAECFRKEIGASNPDLLGFIAKDLGVDPSDEMAFNEKWGDKTTEMGCHGPSSWEYTARYEWTHNETCVNQHICSSWDYKEKIMNDLNIPWQDRNELWTIESNGNETACENFASGWKLDCQWFMHDGTCGYWSCLPPLPAGNETIPCARGDKCRQDCQMNNRNPDICSANNGTWMPNRFECCPQGLFVHNSSWGQECKYVPVGTPQSWEVQDETCCDAIGGTFRRAEWGGMECCLGKLRTYYDSWLETESTYCDTSFQTWYEEEKCYNNCQKFDESCESCYTEREKCWGEKYIPASQSGCLSKTRCNHQELSEDCSSWAHGGQSGSLPTGGFCAHDSGWPAHMEKARCIVRNRDVPLNQASCDALPGHAWTDISGPWDWSSNMQCIKTISDASTNISDCFPTASCAWKLKDYKFSNRFPSLSEEPAGGYLVEGHCPAACILPVASAVEIGVSKWGGANNNDYYYSWCRGLNGRHFTKNSSWSQDYGDICINDWMGSAECNAESGTTYNGYSYEYRPSRRMSQADCEAGECQGKINHYNDPVTGHWLWGQPWSADQCTRLSGNNCDRWCPYCTMSEGQGTGACFNTTGGIASSDRKLTQVGTKASCDSQSSDGAVWYECPQPPLREYEWYNLEQMCTDMPKEASNNIPTEYQNLLGCRAQYDRCKTTQDCTNMGECTDRWEFRTEYCTSPSWKAEWGDAWYYGHEVKTTQEDGTVVTEWKHEECPCNGGNDGCHRKEVEGVCIRDRDSQGRCSDNWEDWHLYHRFGCRVPGFYNETTCEGENAAYTWMAPAANQTECGNRKICKIGWWETAYSASECTECSGEFESIYRWNGGKWRSARHEAYTWHNSIQEESENKWVKVQASWKLTDLLSNPIMKAYANNKVSQYLTTYNLYQAALVSLAENCGISTTTSNTTTVAAADDAEEEKATVVGEKESFTKCGDEDEQIKVLGQTLVISPSCDNNRRRLAASSNSSSLQFFYSSAAENASRYEPCSDSDIFDTMFVKRTDGVYIGQLLGDGIGVKSDKAVGEVDFCLDARDDFLVRTDLFDTVALGKLDEAATTTEGVKVVRNVTANVTFASKSISRVCVSVKEEGIYFPILIADVPDSVNCGLGCISDRSVCVIDGTAATPAPQCLCKCGYSGTTCNLGCPNSCSGQGTCDTSTGVCACNTDSSGSPIYTLDDCSKINCPSNPETGVTCSGRGSCKATSTSATCTCDGGYTGNACQTAPVREINGFNTGGYADSLTTADKAVQSADSFASLSETVQEVEAVKNATPAPTPSDSDSSGSDSPIAAVVGGVVGGVFVIGIAAYFGMNPDAVKKMMSATALKVAPEVVTD